MKQSARNIAVGLTVLVALGMFGGMVLLFAGLPELLGDVLGVGDGDSEGHRSDALGVAHPVLDQVADQHLAVDGLGQKR